MKFCLDGNPNNKWFSLVKRKTSKYEMQYILEKYNIDLNDYYIIKGTKLFKIINVDDIPNYAGVVCFHKSMYSVEYINLWFDKININITPYLVKPFPPEYMLNKIKIINNSKQRLK
jgi:hypothetical protein